MPDSSTEGNVITTAVATRPVEACLIDLFQHLGIGAVHIAAGQLVRNDWHGLATRYTDRVASLTLVSPLILDTSELDGLASRLLVITGDQGRAAQSAIKLRADLPDASSHILPGYECHPWSDVMADRGTEIAQAMLDFLDRHPAPAIALPEREGETAGITYRIRGAGPPLILMPLDLAPSQWEPLIPKLSSRYCTITLSGPTLGVVSMLEERGHSAYLRVVHNVLDMVRIHPGETILEVGGGSGVVLREIARRTAGANPIIDVDFNPYLLREAASLTKHAGLAERMTFRKGNAEAIPLEANSVDVALSFTVMEEGDADRMLSELLRVTKPGGRIAAVVRALDMPWWANLPASAELRAKTGQPGSIGSGAAAIGCADSSLYGRFAAAGLTELHFFPQLGAVVPNIEPIRLALLEPQILAALTAEEAAAWREAATRAKADGTFFIAAPYHCAVGTKPA
jgi:SAM-dependent methyltransferase